MGKKTVRKYKFQLKQALSHKPTLILLIILIIGCIYLFSGSSNDEVERYARENSKNSISRGERLKSEYDSLPGEADPNTIYTPNKKGNFEPPEQIDNGGPGEMGRALHIKETAESRKAMHDYGFNTHVSDMISMERTIPDIRMKECQHWNYPEDLPTASVIIAFHNEGWSPLLRTVHSVILRTPSYLLKEVIMVDDFSDKEHLKGRLDEYIKQFNGKVKLIRNKEREGLIRTRTVGAKAATGDVVVFLDAHCEVNLNWLPPLLAPIKYNRKVMSVPVIDGIDMNTWEYRSVYGSPDAHFRGIFEWGLLYKEKSLSGKEKTRRKYNSEPFRSPTHAGGLFAIDKSWFAELGYYDPGLQIWGGEQYELSFKIWQCGGGILIVPCSHVGHVYRSHMPYNFGKLTGKPVITTNMLRVIRTWMGDYEKYYMIREPQARNRDPGDISQQIALRDKLQCKDFHWYMENVAYDVVEDFPLLPENVVWGEAKNGKTSKCLDVGTPGSIMSASGCHGYGGNQLLRINEQGMFSQGEWCIAAKGNKIEAVRCKMGRVDGDWAYLKESNQIRNVKKNKCISVSESDYSDEVTLQECDPENMRQKFKFREIFNE
uniref:Polypeptide N-acetylgalactosaminyltransferase n=1 Tax=Parastrongyloides trichosuri TaxID=131310 RepID=A0A0N4Z4I9_PARTI